MWSRKASDAVPFEIITVWLTELRSCPAVPPNQAQYAPEYGPAVPPPVPQASALQMGVPNCSEYSRQARLGVPSSNPPSCILSPSGASGTAACLGSEVVRTRSGLPTGAGGAAGDGA